MNTLGKKAASPRRPEPGTPPPVVADAVPSVRRDDILRAARQLFYARGFEASSMRDLAERIGFTQAALYYHFKNKDSILFELIDSFTDKVRVTIEAELNAPADPLEGLMGAIRAQILLSRDHTQDMKLIFEDKKLLGGSYADRVHAKETAIYRLYKDRVDQLVAAGVLRPMSRTLLTFTLLAPVNFIYDWFDANGPLSLEDVAEQTLQILMSGCVQAGVTQPGSRSRRRLA
ncbi:MAG: TetR/AcrR family transcriptional regulator [Rubrivivax sp.]